MADSKLSTPVTIIAVVVLIAFIAAIYYLFTVSSSADERYWSRLLYLYGGIEALAFAAAGYLFGREVHRQQAENAEKRADQKTKEAAVAERKGEQLASSILTTTRIHQGAVRHESVAQGRTEQIEGGDLQALADLASTLYPHLAGK